MVDLCITDKVVDVDSQGVKGHEFDGVLVLAVIAGDKRRAAPRCDAVLGMTPALENHCPTRRRLSISTSRQGGNTRRASVRREIVNAVLV